MKKLLILLAFAFLFLSLTSALTSEKSIFLIITPKPGRMTNIGEIMISRQQWDSFWLVWKQRKMSSMP